MLILVKVFVLSYNTVMKLEQKVVESLIDKKKTVSVAESCTGGLLASRLTDISGSSNCLKGGIIAYSNEVKIKLLRVKPSSLKRYGAVSFEVALEMAKNARKSFNSDLGVGISGIAGPTGGTKAKPVGLVFIAVSSKFDTLCLKCLFKGTRAQIKKQSAEQAMKILIEFI